MFGKFFEKSKQKEDIIPEVNKIEAKEIVSGRKLEGGDKELAPTPKKYQENTIVNGIEIRIGWDSEYEDYTIYFPQIEINEAARKKGVPDQVIRLTTRDDTAKQIFDYAVKLAESEPDVYKLYKKIEKYSRDLSQDEDEE